MDAKLLTEGGWKAKAAMCKVKDNGLQQALAAYEKLEDDAHDDCLKGIARICERAANLKRSKEVAAVAVAAKYLADLLSAFDAEKNDVLKDKAAAQKTAAAKQDECADDDDEAVEQGDLKTALQSIKTAKKPYYFMYCDVKPYGLIISRKDIRKSAIHKKEMVKLSGGVTRAPKCGEVRYEAGKLVFEMEKALGGTARVIQTYIKNSIGTLVKIMVGAESGDDAPGGPEAPGKPGGPEAPGKPAEDMTRPFEISASVGARGKNKPDDVKAVQTALNLRAKAGLVVDDKCGPKTIGAILKFQKTAGLHKPDGLVEVGKTTAHALAGKPAQPEAPPGKTPRQPIPPPKHDKPALATAPKVWRGTLETVLTNIDVFMEAFSEEYSPQYPGLVKALRKRMAEKLVAMSKKLDARLADALAKANAAKDDATRKAELKNCKVILTEAIQYVKSEPLIAQIDSNLFGVPTNLKKVLSDSLMHMAQSIA